MDVTEQEIREFLREPKTFAIIGASTKEHKAGSYVPKFLMNRGFSIIPINPFADEILGHETLDDLEDLDESVDGVIIYRGGDAATKEALRAIDKDIPWVWLPEGVTSEKARAQAGETKFVQDKCPKALIQKWQREGTFD